MRQEEPLINRLVAYVRSDMYPFHMLGHKRRTGPGDFFMNSYVDPFTSPSAVDITEIEGLGNLHHPEDTLRNPAKWAVDVYGADQTYYMINRSTGGILVAVCESVPRDGRVLANRNCHKSVYHGIRLDQLKTSYVYSQEIEELGVQGGIAAEDAGRILNRYMDTQAVLIVCPVCDGIVPDIEAIARIIHRVGLPLIMDETHGTHFRYDAMFPAPVLNLEADVMIQSVRETLPSLTQTALLHIRCNRLDGRCYTDRERVDQYIHMMQGSSPSYMLMASIENDIYQMEQTDVTPYGKQLHKLRRGLGQMRHLRLTDIELIGQAGIRDLDISKIVVSTRGTYLHPTENGSTGFIDARLDDILRKEYHLEVRMCGVDYVTATTTVMDSEKGPERLRDVLTGIDSQLTDTGYKLDGRSGNQKSVYSIRCSMAMSVGEAMEENMASVGLENSAGRISGESVYTYPSDTLIVAPGEWISRPILEVTLEYKDRRLPVRGPADRLLRTTRVVQEDWFYIKTE